ALRNAAQPERARDAPPGAADDDAADDRTGAAPHASDAGADGADAGRRGGRTGRSVIRAAATAVAALAVVVGPFAQGRTSAPISHEYADVNGVRLHYARAGDGPLMIFLHGFPEFWYEWTHQIAEFSRDHTVVAPDMRGYNLSSKPTELSAYQMPL